MKNVLVTGANGKVGKELCKRLRERDYSVVEFHRTPDSDLTNPNDIKKVFETNEDINVVVHLAVTRNPMENPKIRCMETLETDTKMMFDLLRECKEYMVEQVLYASTCAVYGFEEEPGDTISTDDLANDIISLMEPPNDECEGYVTTNHSDNFYPEMKLNPLVYEKEHTCINAVSKLINEDILHMWSRENNIPAVSMRFWPVEEPNV